MPPDMELQSLYPVMPDHEPQLQRAEAPTQRNMPVTVVGHLAGSRGLRAQILRHYREAIDQRLAVGHIEATAVEVGEHPLVGVKDVAVSQLYSPVHGAELRTQRRRARHGRIGVQPEAVLAADGADLRQRIESHG